MATDFSNLFRIPTVASALAVGLLVSAGQANAQATTQLAPGIRNYDMNDPAALAAVPNLLSQAGLYSNIGNKATRAISDTSVTAFEVNSALWSDGSHKERFISLLPGTHIVPNDTSKFAFPDGAVLIKNFLIDTVYGDNSGNSRIYIETRFLIYQVGAEQKGWSSLSYRWNRDQSDAVLVDPELGMDYTHNVVLNGNRVGKRWRYPSKRDCAECHKGDESTSRGTLGFITPQLNRMINGTNQLQSLFARGILSVNPVAGKPNAHRWYAPTETSATLEQRVRSYFASNCSHCHGNGVRLGQATHNFDYFSADKRITFQADPGEFTDSTGAWVGAPSLGGGDFPQLVMPGYPDSSLIMSRMKYRTDDFVFGPDIAQMPPLATSQPDSAAVAMIEQWICSLQAGTPCDKISWLPDDTFWGEEATSVRPKNQLNGLAFQPTLRHDLLSIPASLAGAEVQLWDHRGRKVALKREGEGQFRITRPLSSGVYFLVAGEYRQVLNYIP